jgi:HlyD family secretion protein
VFAPVQLGAYGLDGQVQVLDGLKAGDEVVVYSQKALSAGSRIQVVDALVKTPAGATP